MSVAPPHAWSASLAERQNAEASQLADIVVKHLGHLPHVNPSINQGQVKSSIHFTKSISCLSHRRSSRRLLQEFQVAWFHLRHCYAQAFPPELAEPAPSKDTIPFPPSISITPPATSALSPLLLLSASLFGLVVPFLALRHVQDANKVL
jgi:hypothetical protein